MAEEQEAPAEEETGGGGNKKLIIIFAVVLLVAIGGSVAGTMLLLGGDEEEVAAEEEAPPEPTKAIYHELRPAFVVNYVIGAKARYLQTELSVMSRNPTVIDAVITHAPLVRARILDFLTDQTYSELQTEEGKTMLQEGLLQLLNDMLAEQEVDGTLESVLFSSFVMQ